MKIILTAKDEHAVSDYNLAKIIERNYKKGKDLTLSNSNTFIAIQLLFYEGKIGKDIDIWFKNPNDELIKVQQNWKNDDKELSFHDYFVDVYKDYSKKILKIKIDRINKGEAL